MGTLLPKVVCNATAALGGAGRQGATALGGHRAAMCNPLDDKDGDCAEEENVDKAALMQDELFHKPNQR